MSKILYISNYRDQSGYSQAARDYISALKAVGCPVACRSIKLTPTEGFLNEAVLAAERESTSDCDIVIQHTLPNFFEYHGGFRKNIGLFHLETDRIPQSWVRQCNLMDSIWVSCNHNKKACEDSGVSVPIKVVPIPCDTTKFNRPYKKLSVRQDFPDDFIFYTVGEFNKRKNLEGILRAFHQAFRKNDPVQLLIKTSIPGLPPQETLKHLTEFCQGVKSNIGMYKDIESYKKELIIVDSLSEEHMNSLHTSCDCFVSASFGEAWCLPFIDAMGFGKRAIVPKHTSFLDFEFAVDYFVDSQKEPCFAYPNSVSDVYTGAVNWYGPSITDLADQMYYAAKIALPRKDYTKKQTLEAISDISYERVGNLMKGLLLT